MRLMVLLLVDFFFLDFIFWKISDRTLKKTALRELFMHRVKLVFFSICLGEEK